MNAHYSSKSKLIYLVALILLLIANMTSHAATLSPGVTVDGVACSVVHTPLGKKKWRIDQYDFTEGVSTSKTIFSTKHNKVIQSVACNQDGGTAFFSMQEKVGKDSEIYHLNVTTNQITTLTENEEEDVDIGVSEDGKVVVWQGVSDDGRKSIVVRTYADDNSYSDIRLASKYPYIQPHISSNGQWIIMLQQRPKSTQVVRYEIASQAYEVVASAGNGAREISDPSISDNGMRVLWKERGTKENLVLIETDTGKRSIILSREMTDTGLLSHATLTSDARGIIYSVNRAEKRQNFLHVISTDETVRLGSALRGQSVFSGNQIQATLDIQTFTLDIEETLNGEVTVTPEPNAGKGYLVGTKITIYTTANSGFQWSAWSGFDQCVDKSYYCTFEMPSTDIVVGATFIAKPTYTLELLATNGEVEVTTPPNADGGYYEDTYIRLIPKANSGFHFKEWTRSNLCDQYDETFCTFYMPPQDAVVEANFTKVLNWVEPDSVIPLGFSVNDMAKGSNDTFHFVAEDASSNPLIGRYDSDGKIIRLEEFEYNKKFFNLRLTGIDADDSDNIYVYGEYISAGDRLLFLAKIDSNGERLWSRNIESDKGISFIPNDIEITQDGKVWLVGHIDIDSLYASHRRLDVSLLGSECMASGIWGCSGWYRGFVVSYDKDGERQLFKEYAPDSNSVSFHALDSDSLGNVFIGISHRDRYSYNLEVALLVFKLNSQGEQVWSSQFSAHPHYNKLGGLNVTASGATYVASRNNSDGQITVTKLNSKGRILKTLKASISRNVSLIRNTTLDEYDNFYVLGSTYKFDQDWSDGQHNVFFDMFLIKVGSLEEAMTPYQFGSPDYDLGNILVAGDDGQLFISGETSNFDGLSGDINGVTDSDFLMQIDSEKLR